MSLVACAALLVLVCGFSQSSRRTTSRAEALHEVLAQETRSAVSRQMYHSREEHRKEGRRAELPLFKPSISPTAEPPRHAMPTEPVNSGEEDEDGDESVMVPAAVSVVSATAAAAAAARQARSEPAATPVSMQQRPAPVDFEGERAHAAAMAKIHRTRAEQAAGASAADAVGCVDSSGTCPTWASAGECKRNPVFMHKQCRWSCGVCGSGAPRVDGYLGGAHEDENERYAYDPDAPPVSAPKEEPKPCVDLAAAGSCDKWAEAGECDRNPVFMHRQCQLACGLCQGLDPALLSLSRSGVPSQSTPPPRQAEPFTAQPRDVAGQRAVGGSGGSVPTALGAASPQPVAGARPADTLGGGRHTAGGACVDGDELCSVWFQAGECRLNPSFMTVNCRKSCGECA
jgi:hypothetical protein